MNKLGKRKKIVVFIFAAVVILAFVAWVAWGNTALMVENIAVFSDRLPDAFSGFRIAHISDLHNGEFGKGNEKLLGLIAESEPDLIAVTGDLVDSNRTNVGIALDFAASAAKIAPIYYVTGNHEAKISGSEYDQLMAGLEAAGAVILDDLTVPVEYGGGEIRVSGLSDPRFLIQEGIYDIPDRVSAKLEEMGDGTEEFTLLLSHRPELFDTYVDCGVDLVLSGHAHGGQFRLPLVGGIIAPDQGLFPKYDAGLYTEGRTAMVVSRGIGNSVIPFRVNNRPEVVMVILYPRTK